MNLYTNVLVKKIKQLLLKEIHQNGNFLAWDSKRDSTDQKKNTKSTTFTWHALFMKIFTRQSDKMERKHSLIRKMSFLKFSLNQTSDSTKSSWQRSSSHIQNMIQDLSESRHFFLISLGSKVWFLKEKHLWP